MVRGCISVEWTDHLLYFLPCQNSEGARAHGVSANARAREVFQAGPRALPQEHLFPGNELRRQAGRVNQVEFNFFNFFFDEFHLFSSDGLAIVLGYVFLSWKYLWFIQMLLCNFKKR